MPASRMRNPHPRQPIRLRDAEEFFILYSFDLIDFLGSNDIGFHCVCKFSIAIHAAGVIGRRFISGFIF
jgi:hypothetical protein